MFYVTLCTSLRCYIQKVTKITKFIQQMELKKIKIVGLSAFAVFIVGFILYNFADVYWAGTVVTVVVTAALIYIGYLLKVHLAVVNWIKKILK